MMLNKMLRAVESSVYAFLLILFIIVSSRGAA